MHLVDALPTVEDPLGVVGLLGVAQLLVVVSPEQRPVHLGIFKVGVSL